ARLQVLRNAPKRGAPKREPALIEEGLSRYPAICQRLRPRVISWVGTP
ncbi:unnamed protein product, partial [Heterotrigona itama]